MPSDDHTPRGHAARYVDACYAGMRDDVVRTAAYRRAIAAAANGHVVLDIGTGALALLALFAAESGAEHVYALEVNESAFAAAQRTVAASPFADRVTVLHTFSTDATLALPSPATLLVHELIGEVAGEEGVVAAISDAARRHLAPHAPPPLSIPARSRSLVAPCTLPDDGAPHAADAASARGDGLGTPPCAGVVPCEGPGAARALKLHGLPAEWRLAPVRTLRGRDLTGIRLAWGACWPTEWCLALARPDST